MTANTKRQKAFVMRRNQTPRRAGRLALLALAVLLLPGMQAPDPRAAPGASVPGPADHLQAGSAADPLLPTLRGPRHAHARDIDADIDLFLEQFAVAVDRRDVLDPLAEADARFRHRRGHALIEAGTTPAERARLQAVLTEAENELTDMLLEGWSLRLNGAACTMGRLLRQRVGARLDLPRPTSGDGHRLCATARQLG